MRISKPRRNKPGKITFTEEEILDLCYAHAKQLMPEKVGDRMEMHVFHPKPDKNGRVRRGRVEVKVDFYS